MRGLSLVAASGGHSSSQCACLSLLRPLLLRSTGSRRASSTIVAHGSSRSVACGIFLDQGSNPCPLHWQADSQPLRHQGSPIYFLDVFVYILNRNFKTTIIKIEVISPSTFCFPQSSFSPLIITPSNHPSVKARNVGIIFDSSFSFCTHLHFILQQVL